MRALIEQVLLVGFPLVYLFHYIDLSFYSTHSLVLMATVVATILIPPHTLRNPIPHKKTTLVVSMVMLILTVKSEQSRRVIEYSCLILIGYSVTALPQMTVSCCLILAGQSIPPSWATLAFYTTLALASASEATRLSHNPRSSPPRHHTTPPLVILLGLLALVATATVIRQLTDWTHGTAFPYPATTTATDSLYVQSLAAMDAAAVTAAGVAVVSTLPAARVSTRRKYFHLVALLTLARLHAAYPTAVVADTTLIGLAGALAVEAARLRFPTTLAARAASRFMTSFADHNKGELARAPIVSHIMLLAGLCVPLWLSQPGMCVPDYGWWLGIASTGVGDAAASVVPSLLLSTTPWPLNRRKSVEGAIACSLAFCGVALALTGEPHVRLALVVGATEATVASTDNLLLPVAAAAAQLSSCALYRSHAAQS